MYDFNVDLALSHRYEQKFAEWLHKHGMRNIELAPQDRIFEDWDVQSPNDTYEIKYDRYYEGSRHLLIETYSDAEKGSGGWFLKTKADWFIMFYNDYQFIGLPMEAVRDCWFNKPQIWKKMEIKHNSNRTSICWVAPIDYFSIVTHGDVRL